MKKLITESVGRFLAWKLPTDFAPDAGITFKPNANTDSPIELQYKHEPMGTNLFHTGQAESMLTHVCKPLVDKIETLESDLQLQTKVFIAACEDLALIAEKLGIDAEDGGASPILDRITELESQLQQHQWQPIETAPKDGTVILVNRNIEQGYEKRVCGTDYFKEGSWWLSRAEMQPTQWMPLPTAPSIAEGKQA